MTDFSTFCIVSFISLMYHVFLNKPFNSYNFLSGDTTDWNQGTQVLSPLSTSHKLDIWLIWDSQIVHQAYKIVWKTSKINGLLIWLHIKCIEEYNYSFPSRFCSDKKYTYIIMFIKKLVDTIILKFHRKTLFEPVQTF